MQETTFIGRIIDNKKQAPISGAKVFLKGDGMSIYTYTDIEGIYRFRVIPGSKGMDATITIEAQGYSPYTQSVYLSSQEKDLGDFRLGGVGGSLSRTSSNGSYSSSNSRSSSNFLVVIFGIAIALIIFFAFSNRTQTNRTPDSPPNPTRTADSNR